jgi:hypothetical protein
MPYLAHIKSLTPTWKTLRYLSDWMEVGTTPLRWRSTDERGDRADKTTVTFMEFRDASTQDTQEVDSPSALKELLHSLRYVAHEEPPLRLFVVEDLSQKVIELLGARFDIDPMCFREQVDDYVWHNVRDPWAQPPSLLSNMKHRRWFRMRNMRLRYYTSQEDFDGAWREANKWNVLRRPEGRLLYEQYVRPALTPGQTT